MKKDILKDLLDEKATIIRARSDLNFLKKYVGNNTLLDYISAKWSSDEKGGKKSVSFINYDRKLLNAIGKKDFKQSLLDERINAILSLDSPYCELLYKLYVEKLTDEDVCNQMEISKATKKRRLREAFIQYAIYLGIEVYKNEKKEVENSKKVEKLSEKQDIFSQSGHDSGHDTVHDGGHDSVHDEIASAYEEMLIEFCKIPRSRDEMQTFCKVGSRPYFSRFIVQPLVEKGSLKMTHPDKPKSKNQRYFSLNDHPDSSDFVSQN